MNDNDLPNITDENEQEYWIELKKTSSPRIREAIVIKYAPLVKHVAGRIPIKIKVVEFGDLVGFGSIGLLDAIDKYNPNKCIKFKTYAHTRIQGAIYDELRKIDDLPRSVRQEWKLLEKAREILEVKLQRAAQPKEIANTVGITLAKYNEIMRYIWQTTGTTSIDEDHYDEDGNAILLKDKLKASSKMNPDYLAEKEEIQKEIINVLKKLPPKEQEVLILYYYEGMTLKEIGETLEVSESRVSQLHTKAIQDLRHSLQEIKKSLL